MITILLLINHYTINKQAVNDIFQSKNFKHYEDIVRSWYIYV